MTKEEQIREDCWNKALHALGTSYVFSQKANSFKWRIRLLTVLGLIVPLLLGGIVIAYGQTSLALKIAIIFAAPITVLQIILFGVALVYQWDNRLAYSLESQTDNRIISDEFQNLGKFSASDINELEKKYEVLKAKDNARTVQDEKITFTKKDFRKGMRYGLMMFKRECSSCHEIPKTMSPTKCDTCGNF